MLEAVLFDMDGVLVRSEEVWFRVVEAAGRAFGNVVITRDAFFPTFGQGTAADIPFFGLSCTVAQLDAFYVEHFVKHLDGVWVNPDAEPTLKALTTRGLKVALVTNTIEPLASRVIEAAGLGRWFEVRATPTSARRAKPAPDLLWSACENLGVAASRAVMVGDSKYDRGAADAAGIDFVGFRLDAPKRIDSLLALVDAIDSRG